MQGDRSGATHFEFHGSCELQLLECEPISFTFTANLTSVAAPRPKVAGGFNPRTQAPPKGRVAERRWIPPRRAPRFNRRSATEATAPRESGG